MGDRSAEMYLRILLQMDHNLFMKIGFSYFGEEPDFGLEGASECQPVVLERKTVLRMKMLIQSLGTIIPSGPLKQAMQMFPASSIPKKPLFSNTTSWFPW